MCFLKFTPVTVTIPAQLPLQRSTFPKKGNLFSSLKKNSIGTGSVRREISKPLELYRKKFFNYIIIRRKKKGKCPKYEILITQAYSQVMFKPMVVNQGEKQYWVLFLFLSFLFYFLIHFWTVWIFYKYLFLSFKILLKLKLWSKKTF